MPRAIEIIREEHHRYLSVLALVRDVVHRAGEDGGSLDADLVEQAFEYVEGFIGTFHHTKEDVYLFSAVRARAPDHRQLVNDLETEHVQGARALAHLRGELGQWRDAPTGERFATLRDALDAYVDFEAAHAEREDAALLPIAEERLTPDDWAAIDAAFEDNADPAFGAAPRARFAEMLAEIARRAPAARRVPP